MNVTEFAEQIVFGKTLEDKLIVPGRLTHGAHRNLPNVSTLAAPNRPVGLEMRHDPCTASPPRDDQLENERARGQLLHFLANHELLATELMALVLLKFPEAPHAFRQGVLVTLQEEQQHTRMYIQRMRECGVEFGTYPLGGRFWRIVEPMQSPMDFVSRLSLTFEQANLDYSLHFASVFDRIGDADTAGLLQKIYEDEIGHVKHGLHWFRQWKDPEQSDWEAYQQWLEPPISPQHGLGPIASFNRKGRELAGLNNEFIDSIEVFRRSRGRPSIVRWFDAGAESELAGESRSPLLDQLGKDLELVMVALARQDDVVLVRQAPSRDALKHLIDAGFDLPEFVELKSSQELSSRRLAELVPWAWTPESFRISKPLQSASIQQPIPWLDQWSELYRKSWASRQLGQWLDPNTDDAWEVTTPEWFCETDSVGIEIFDEPGLLAGLRELNSRGFDWAVFKIDLGASGRGQRRLDTRRPLDQANLRWFRRLLADHIPPANSDSKHVAVGILEPELNRLLDLSFLWDINREHSSSQSGVPTWKYQGFTRSLVTDARKYVGTRLAKPFYDCPGDVKQFLLPNQGEKIEAIADWLESRLLPAVHSAGFRGCLGVDAFLFRTVDGELRIKPLVELNPRTTMGHVALSMQKKVAAGVVAEFRILTISQWLELPDAVKQAPVQRGKDGRWSSGCIRLGDVAPQTRFVPVILLGRTCVNGIHDD